MDGNFSNCLCVSAYIVPSGVWTFMLILVSHILTSACSLVIIQQVAIMTRTVVAAGCVDAVRIAFITSPITLVYI